MKLIIFEATDRCGKDTYIEKLTQGLRNYTIRHWSFPQGYTNEDKTQWQINSFHDEFGHYLWLRTKFANHTLFWNRAHLGELVYGTLFRDSNPTAWVPQLETSYGMNNDPDVYLVHLTADPEFVAAKDDGKSYSAKIETKIKEVEAFTEAVNNSKIQNKITIKVNDGDNYRDLQTVLNEIRGFIGI
jgi:hypothetical protein